MTTVNRSTLVLSSTPSFLVRSHTLKEERGMLNCFQSFQFKGDSYIQCSPTRLSSSLILNVLLELSPYTWGAPQPYAEVDVGIYNIIRKYVFGWIHQLDTTVFIRYNVIRNVAMIYVFKEYSTYINISEKHLNLLYLYTSWFILNLFFIRPFFHSELCPSSFLFREPIYFDIHLFVPFPFSAHG